MNNSNKYFHLDFCAGICAILSVMCFTIGGYWTWLTGAARAEEVPTYISETSEVIPITEEAEDEYETEIAIDNISDETIETGEVQEVIEVEHSAPKAYMVKNSECLAPVYEDADFKSDVTGYISDGDVLVASVVSDDFAAFSVDDDLAYISLECLEEYVVEIQPVQEIEIADSFVPFTSIKSSSGLTEDEITHLLKGSYMEEYAYLYYNAEKTSGINAYYMLAVSQLESGWGRSDAGLYYNNIFGLMTSKGGLQWFESKEACVEYWLKLMTDFYINRGLDTPYEIGPVYCTSDWPPVICEFMNNLVAKVERYRQESL